jgi:hypothetical protein
MDTYDRPTTGRRASGMEDLTFGQAPLAWVSDGN